MSAANSTNNPPFLQGFYTLCQADNLGYNSGYATRVKNLVNKDGRCVGTPAQIFFLKTFFEYFHSKGIYCPHQGFYAALTILSESLIETAKTADELALRNLCTKMKTDISTLTHLTKWYDYCVRFEESCSKTASSSTAAASANATEKDSKQDFENLNKITSSLETSTEESELLRAIRYYNKLDKSATPGKEIGEAVLLGLKQNKSGKKAVAEFLTTVSANSAATEVSSKDKDATKAVSTSTAAAPMQPTFLSNLYDLLSNKTGTGLQTNLEQFRRDLTSRTHVDLMYLHCALTNELAKSEEAHSPYLRQIVQIISDSVTGDIWNIAYRLKKKLNMPFIMPSWQFARDTINALPYETFAHKDKTNTDNDALVADFTKGLADKVSQISDNNEMQIVIDYVKDIQNAKNPISKREPSMGEHTSQIFTEDNARIIRMGIIKDALLAGIKNNPHQFPSAVTFTTSKDNKAKLMQTKLDPTPNGNVTEMMKKLAALQSGGSTDDAASAATAANTAVSSASNTAASISSKDAK